MKLNWNFLGGGGRAKQKNLLWGEYGYFLELHIGQKSFSASNHDLVLRDSEACV